MILNRNEKNKKQKNKTNNLNNGKYYVKRNGYISLKNKREKKCCRATKKDIYV